MQPTRQAVLALADGTVFLGRGFGAPGDSEGEVVFNTSMTGYPELLSDPSYRRQIVCLTYPEIGNYGVTRRDQESEGVQVSGLVVRALSPRVSNWRSELDLDMWLKEAGVPGIVGIDTRALVRHIRDRGAMMGVVRVAEPGVHISDDDCLALVEKAKGLPGMEGCALTDEVTIKVPTPFTEGLLDDLGQPLPPKAPPTRHIVAVDLGMKRSIARLLVHHGCRVTIVPARTSAEKIKSLNPDGLFLSNGPGDPATLTYVVDAVRELLGQVPMFGICMGHQVMAQALGATTFKTEFGHRGGNQPVKEPDGRVLITSQNHGFAVRDEGLKNARASSLNVSDGTNEGLMADGLYAMSVQYHPEAAPGPNDARIYFQRFIDLCDRFANDKKAGKAPVSPPSASTAAAAGAAS
jgi:carbamoyl-phosphate synthase small subunit